ncbi:zinc finger domain-containing protein [Mycobacterium numidiamassiliense]|uniref:zinc finger domain-containing protein n=1 Tax=Mycobacterium numidiamassiliense TaxID=1841861 RepID=UPI003CCBCA93
MRLETGDLKLETYLALIFLRGAGVLFLPSSIGPQQPRSSRRRPSRTHIRSVACPYCIAIPGALCIGSRGKPREANHFERILEFEAWRWSE